jgi:hypothetical protein
VPGGFPRHEGIVDRLSDIRSTPRSTGLWPGAVISSLTWEPVSGFEPLTCAYKVVLRVAAQLPRSWREPVSSSSGYCPESVVSARFWHAAGTGKLGLA